MKVVQRMSGELDFVHLFVTDNHTLNEMFGRAMKCLKRDGMLWVSWPKKASKIATDLEENGIREFGLKSGLVDVKVYSVTEVWSGLKFVWRLKNR